MGGSREGQSRWVLLAGMGGSRRCGTCGDTGDLRRAVGTRSWRVGLGRLGDIPTGHGDTVPQPGKGLARPSAPSVPAPSEGNLLWVTPCGDTPNPGNCKRRQGTSALSPAATTQGCQGPATPLSSERHRDVAELPWEGKLRQGQAGAPQGKARLCREVGHRLPCSSLPLRWVLGCPGPITCSPPHRSGPRSWGGRAANEPCGSPRWCVAVFSDSEMLAGEGAHARPRAAGTPGLLGR